MMFGHRNAVGDARKRRLSSFWLLLLMMTAIGCSQGSSSGGCSCAEPIPGGFPQAKKIGGVGQVALAVVQVDGDASNILQLSVDGGNVRDEQAGDDREGEDGVLVHCVVCVFALLARG